MKIGTLLTAAIVSLSAVGGGLAVYVAASKYQTMDKVSVAQSRLEVVRAVGEIPRYMNPERGFATNILYGPAAVDPKTRAELNEKYRKQTDGARDKMNAIRKDLSFLYRILFWLLLALLIYALNLGLAFFIQRPNLRRLIGVKAAGDDQVWRERAKRQRYVSYLMAGLVGVIGFLMSMKPTL